MLAVGGDTALRYQQNESRLKAEQQKKNSLEALRRETNSLNNQDRQTRERENFDYQNSLKTGGVDPETGLGRSNKWIAEHPDSNTVGVEKFRADNKRPTLSAEERIIANNFGGDANAFYAAKNRTKGGMSGKDRAKIILDVADSDAYRMAVLEAESYNKEDIGSWKPGVQFRPESEMKAIPTPEEFAMSMGLLQNDAQPYTPASGGQGINDQPVVNDNKVTDDVKAAADLIVSGKRTKESLVKRFGADNEFVKSVLNQVGKTAVIDPEKIKKEKSNPAKWNNVMADAMGKALDFKLNPAEAIGKAAGSAAESAANNIPKALKGLGKVAKAAYYGLSESAKAIVAANDKLKNKLKSVTTEEDARKFMDEVQKVIDADTYDYGTGNIYEPRPL